MAVLSAIWAFLSSSAGQTLVLALIAAIFGKSLSNNKRAQQIAGLWQEAFAAAEKYGLLNNLKGSEKWLRAVEFVSSALQAAGLGPLSAQEMEAGKQAATRYGWLNKDVKTQLADAVKTVP